MRREIFKAFVMSLLCVSCSSPPLCEVPVRFEPQQDISAYELAYINLHGGAGGGTICFTQEQWDTLPPGISRHFWSTGENK
jgi:hypothetical protein